MRTLDRYHLMSIDDFDDLLDPTTRSLLEVIWAVTSPALPGYDLQCTRSKMRASLLGSETILRDAIFLNKFRSIRQNNSPPQLLSVDKG